MKVILATRNRYLEYGLQQMLEGYRIILAREFFTPENRKSVPAHDESWVIICDALLGRLMCCMFQGRRYLQIDAEDVTGRLETYRKIRNGEWVHNTYARPLTMSEMVVMFGYVYRESKPCHLAREMGINTKTVNTFLYIGLGKNGLKYRSVKHLVGCA
ncbi:hypothetical protein F8546_004423 [Escherichia coli]|uniref:hypothetical protein n=1 Tax=Escherichia coli TaxID=562 RepID=UPI0007A6300D|nr:hypothetical protein [Escherichia coli]EED0073040.1 hypothetical protein [Escherichia coli]EEQ3361561.1 hypothetical protein [Escherichia coli]EEQ4761068.1 hypothetical protein [Escherichia coli]EER3518743.1 hypothetical protein [Escherichia coli]EES0146995.1 hypothetical protein [Escherichia coli]